MDTRDLKPGDHVTCLSCRAAYEVTADGSIESRDDARCRVCRTIIVKWPQFVGLRLIPPAEEASA